MLTAAGLFTTAFADVPERVNSTLGGRGRRLETVSICRGEGGSYMPIMGGMGGIRVIGIYYRDADSDIGQPRILVSHTEGELDRVLGPETGDRAPTVIKTFHNVEVPQFKPRIRFTVYDPRSSSRTDPLAEVTAEAPDCG